MLRHYATFAPAQLLQTSQKRRDFDVIALGNLNEHADTPHPLVLLRAPSGHAAAPPSAAISSRRPIVTGMWPSRARAALVKGTISHRKRAVFTLGGQRMQVCCQGRTYLRTRPSRLHAAARSRN